MRLNQHKFSLIKKLVSALILAFCLASCSSTSTFVGVNDNTLIGTNINFDKQKIAFIDSYISYIDHKSNDTESFDISELEILGNERAITANEFNKYIVLKNQSIVRVQYKDHLYNNFIKSKVFYYNQDELVCIKIIEVLPDEFNNVGVSKRTIYVHENQPISHTIESGIIDEDEDLCSLVALGQNSLKNEYSALN